MVTMAEVEKNIKRFREELKREYVAPIISVWATGRVHIVPPGGRWLRDFEFSLELPPAILRGWVNRLTSRVVSALRVSTPAVLLAGLTLTFGAGMLLIGASLARSRMAKLLARHVTTGRRSGGSEEADRC